MVGMATICAINNKPNSTYKYQKPQENHFYSRLCTEKTAIIAWNVFSTVIFPIGLIRLSSFLLGKLVARVGLLPVVGMTCLDHCDYQARQSPSIDAETLKEKITEQVKQSKQENKIKNIVSYDGTELSILEVNHNNECPWIVHFPGNAVFMEEMLKETKNNKNVNFLMANYRGVGESKGSPSCFQDLVNDGIDLVRYLLQEGVNPSTITISGHSLGGAIALHVSRKLESEGLVFKKVEVYHTFRKISDVVYSFVMKLFQTIFYSGKFKWYFKPLLAIPLAAISIIALPIIHATLVFTGWNPNNLPTFKVIRSAKTSFYTNKDTIVPFGPAQLSHHLLSNKEYYGNSHDEIPI